MAIVQVQHVANYPGNSQSITLTAGSLVVIYYQGFDATAGFVCNGSLNSYSHFAGIVADPGGLKGFIQGWYKYNSAAGSETITVGSTGGSDESIDIFEYSGVQSSADPLIDSDSVDGSTSPLQFSLTTEAGCLISAAWGDENTDGYSSPINLSLILHDPVRFNALFEVLSGPSTSSIVGANTGGSATDTFIAGAFRAATGGGGGGTNSNFFKFM